MLRQERHQRQQSLAEEDDLEELENVTSDIKEWLTSTFATKQQVRVPAYITVHYIDYISPYTLYRTTANKKVCGDTKPQICG